MVIRVGILTIPVRDNAAIHAITQKLHQALPDAVVMQESSAPSQRNWIEEILRRWCDEEELDLIITIGGTFPAPGPSAAEIVPEATLRVVERLLPGLPEAMRAYAQEQSSLALLDRSVAGIRGRSCLLNLPASAAPAVLFFEAIADVLGPLLAHLRGESSAPTLADVLEIEQQEAGGSIVEQTPDATKGLKAEEFAAFLQRKRTAD
ncbi:MAG: molybdopterin-binding protein [Caldilineaceae bacterium]